VSGASGQRADGTEHAARLSDLKTLDDPEKDEGTLTKGGNKSHGEEGCQEGGEEDGQEALGPSPLT
jgi:hypothetical protein